MRDKDKYKLVLNLISYQHLALENKTYVTHYNEGPSLITSKNFLNHNSSLFVSVFILILVVENTYNILC